MATKKTTAQKIESTQNQQAKLEERKIKLEQEKAKLEEKQTKLEEKQTKLEEKQNVEIANAAAIEKATVSSVAAIEEAQKSVAHDLSKAGAAQKISGFYIMRAVDKVIKSLAYNKDLELTAANNTQPVDKTVNAKFTKLLNIFLGGYDTDKEGAFYYIPERTYLTEYKIGKAKLFGLNMSLAMRLKHDTESVESFFKQEVEAFRENLFTNFTDEKGRIDYASAYKYFSGLATRKEEKIYGMPDAVKYLIKKFNGHADNDLQDFIDQLKADYKNVL